jgi:hypothetical protein
VPSTRVVSRVIVPLPNIAQAKEFPLAEAWRDRRYGIACRLPIPSARDLNIRVVCINATHIPLGRAIRLNHRLDDVMHAHRILHWLYGIYRF